MIKSLLEFTLCIFFNALFYFDKRAWNSPGIKRVSELYKNTGFSELFAKIRIWDAPLEMIAELVPQMGTVVDLGCGDGLFTNYLALDDSGRRVVGIEINPSRIKEAEKGIKNVKFQHGDILKTDFPLADTILLIHVLHHLSSYEQQMKLIDQCKDKLKKDGNLIIVEIIKRPFLKYLFTWLVDVLVFAILFEEKTFNSKIFYRSDKDWRDLLTKKGFSVKTKKASKGKPFSHMIFCCRKQYNFSKA